MRGRASISLPSMTKPPPFGTVFAPQMAVASFERGSFGAWEIEKTADFSLHPAAHVFHYGSACFEGLKAHLGLDGSARIFRLDAHAARLVESATLLCLPPPPVELTIAMVEEVVRMNREEIPDAPGSLYLRPTVIGTEANIGAAAHPPASGLYFVIASPVGDYFAGGIRPLRILIEEDARRSTEGFGMAKTGGNYAAALRTVVAARNDLGADQVLFAPNGLVEETGASNFLLISDEVVVTASLSASFLHGVTRDSTLRLAETLGYRVEERPLPVREVLGWEGEAALSGTAAVLSGVGTFIHKGEEVTIGGGEVGPNTVRLRAALTDIHRGAAEDRFGWVRVV
jgi:branched-chain amino acid aminotransferase